MNREKSFFDYNFIKYLINGFSILAISYVSFILIDRYSSQLEYNEVEIADQILYTDTVSPTFQVYLDTPILDVSNELFYSKENLKKIYMSDSSGTVKKSLENINYPIDSFIPVPNDPLVDYIDTLTSSQSDSLISLIELYNKNWGGIKFYLTLLYPFMYSESVDEFNKIFFNKIKNTNIQLSNFVLLTYDLHSRRFSIYLDDEILKVLSITELQSLIENEIKPRMKIDNFSGIYNSVIIVGNKIIDKRNGN